MELVNIIYNGLGVEAQTYSTTDERLITNSYLNVVFGDPNDYIESFIYDDDNQLLESDYLLERYSPNAAGAGNLEQYSSVTLDPKADINEKGYTRGSLNIQYNFLRNLFNSSYTNNYWIKEISTSRTELKLTSQTISDNSIQSGFDDYQAYAQSKNYYSDFYLNFGNNELIIAINVAYTEDDSGSYLLIKLYEPLPIDYDVKTTLWIVDRVAESVSYNVDIQVEADAVVDPNALRGPNFKIAINDKVGQTTPYYNYQNLFSSNVSSSFQQLMSYLDDKAITINVDYSNFSNFVHFSSAAERLNNFVYKLRLIESYNAQITAQKSLSGGGVTASGSINSLTQSIQNITEKFDNYEYYLYYNSESFAWPKSTSTKPYQLYSVTSSQAISWLGSPTTVPTGTTASVLYSASFFDTTNKDLLTNTIPQYLQDDSNNQPYVTFLNMIGQHFDNIWIYYKDVTNRYNNTNNPETGISIDMVGDALRGLGVSLYTNTNLSNDLYYSLFGVQSNGSLLPPTGSEVITNFVTSSIPSISPNQLEKEAYKRIYHNLPYLLKTKGTHRGIKALLACYGVPEDILAISEFGGTNRYQEIGIYEINNNKVDIDTTGLEISSSLLSPYTTIQYHNTDNRMDTLEVEVGFSPSNTINKEISSSLGYFNIDQYIGAPANQYSSSYNYLDALKNTYFAAYNQPHSVNEYIRLIKFYNNSLFKMIKDFVPAKADLSTGIIIKPHILERNKYARNEPTATTSSYESSVDMISISATDAPELKYTTDYTETIQSISGSVAIHHTDNYEKYTGEFGGTVITPHSNYFSQSEQSYQPGSNIAPIQVPMLATYQNVTSSVKSTRFFDLDYSSNQSVPVNLNLITQSINQGPTSQLDPYAPYAQLQDYNYSIRRSVIPRYSGSYLSGKLYNIYSPEDISYGNEPVINRYTNKLGLFTQVATSSFLPGKVNVSLAYLVDVQGGLLELNQQNTSWQDVQNIFKAGANLTIKQFDNKKYSNQKSTDGIKRIFESGYSYSPQLYFTSGQGRFYTDTKLYFQLVDDEIISNEFIARNSSSNFINGSTTNRYTGSAGNVYNLFDSIENNDSGEYTTGSVATTTWPTYSPNQTGVKSFITNFNVNTAFASINQSVTYSLNIKNGATNLGSQTIQFKSTQSAAQNSTLYLTASIGSYGVWVPGFNYSIPDPIFQPNLTFPIDVYNQLTNTYITTISSSQGLTLGTFDIYDSTTATYISSQVGIYSTSASLTGYYGLDAYYVGTTIAGTPAVNTLTSTSSFNLTTTATTIVPLNDVTFEFNYIVSDITQFTASVTPGILTVATTTVGQGGYPYATSSVPTYGPFINSITSSLTQSDIVLNQSLSGFLGYQYVPTFSSASVDYTSSLYNRYSDVNDAFNPTTGDKIIINDFSGVSQQVDVLSTNFDNITRLLHITVIPALLSNWTNDPTLISEFLLLKKNKDEQNAILTFNKINGATSYGFIIPENINPTVLANINSIQSAVQSQLLSNQADTTI